MPPPPGMAPPRRKSNTALIITIILICVLVPCIAVVGFIFWGIHIAKNNIMPWVGCGINLEQAAYSIRDYAKDHNGMLPKASDWQDEVRSYVIKRGERKSHKDNPFGTMNPNKPYGCQPSGDAQHGSGIAFNSDLSGKKLDDVKDTQTILVYEIEAPAANASGPYKDRGETAPPFFAGAKREWLTVDVHGHLHGMDSSRHSGSFNEDWSDSSDSSSSSDSSGTSGAKANTSPAGKADSKAQPATAGQ